MICAREASRKPDPAMLQKLNDKILTIVRMIEDKYGHKPAKEVRQQFDSIGFRN
jgi:hypothetical protein